MQQWKRCTAIGALNLSPDFSLRNDQDAVPLGRQVRSMHRSQLLEQLFSHPATDADEVRARLRMVEFVRRCPDCFERSNREGHFTGSAWLIDDTAHRVLLTHHRKLGKWLQLGGHADGDRDVLAVAMREAHEESGLRDITALSPRIFDLDVHAIPERGGEPEHFHYDVRFLLQTRHPEQLRTSDESHELRWFHVNEFACLDVDESVMRMYRKWLRWLDQSDRLQALSRHDPGDSDLAEPPMQPLFTTPRLVERKD